MRWARAARVLFLVVLASLMRIGTASAHPTPGSIAFVDFTVDGARIEQDVPIEEIQRVFQRQLVAEGETPAATVGRLHDFLRAYASQHLQAFSVDDGSPWSVDVADVVGHDGADGPRATFRFALRAPPGKASGSVRIHDDLVAHEVVTHYTTVFVRTDWASGVAEGKARLVGTIHAGRNDVTVARDGSFGRGFRSIVGLGLEHIATGTDHLMFLFALLLAAPAVASGGSWRSRRGTRDTLLVLARVVSAFTVGHSITLAISALGGGGLPSVFVEAAIAITILVTAVHAFRPIFPRREALVACAFGLVHGLAFASALAGRDLGRAQMIWTLLGFNVGIELAQLGLLFVVMPWVLILARTRAYGAFRGGGAVVAALLALGWLVERTTSFANPFARPVAWAEQHPLPLLVLLIAGTLVARLARGAPATTSAQATR